MQLNPPVRIMVFLPICWEKGGQDSSVFFLMILSGLSVFSQLSLYLFEDLTDFPYLDSSNPQIITPGGMGKKTLLKVLISCRYAGISPAQNKNFLHNLILNLNGPKNMVLLQFSWRRGSKNSRTQHKISQSCPVRIRHGLCLLELSFHHAGTFRFDNRTGFSIKILY
jgi:hypothetical protein